jgi:ABC-type amino acid transport system permease subunit
MIKDTHEKLIVALLVLVFSAACFFSVKFLRAKIIQATTAGQKETAGSLNLDDWQKIKHHFSQ